LRIYGLHHTLDCVEKMMALYEWDTWPDFFPVAFHRIPAQAMITVLENEDFRIFSSPVKHIVPTIGLRIEPVSHGKVIAYSCDTEPCPQVVDLGKGADVLLHEATGDSYGHSSAAQAGEIAQAAGVRSLYFIHYPAQLIGSEKMVNEASKYFQGEIRFATDLLTLEF
jgi:ribonuclease Z